MDPGLGPMCFRLRGVLQNLCVEVLVSGTSEWDAVGGGGGSLKR